MGRVVGVMSARADGATTVALGLAAVMASRQRTLLVDLDLEVPELAPLLDLDGSVNLHHLAHSAQLAPIGADELERHLRWRDGLAVLPGISDRRQQDRIEGHFLHGLVEAAMQRFDAVVMDLGRVHARAWRSLAPHCRLLWAVTPSPVGLEVLEREWWALEEARKDIDPDVSVVLNRVGEDSLAGAARYLEHELGIATVGEIPNEPTFWRRLEMRHSLEPLVIRDTNHQRYRTFHGPESARTRAAFELLRSRIEESDGQAAEAAHG